MTGRHTERSIEYAREELDMTDPQDLDIAAKYNIDSVVLDYLEMETDPAAKAEALAQHAANVQAWAESTAYGEGTSEAAAATPAAAAYEENSAALSRPPKTSPITDDNSVPGEETELYEIIREYVDEILDRYNEPLSMGMDPGVEEDAGEIDAEYDLPDSVGEMFGSWDQEYGSARDPAGSSEDSDSYTSPEYSIPESAGEMFDAWDSEFGGATETGDSVDADGSVTMDTDTGPSAAPEGPGTSEAAG